MKTQKEIIEAIAESLTLPATDVNPESHLQEDLGLNLVEIADLMEDLSQKFHIIFDPAEIEQINSVNDLVELVEDKLLE